jgi:SnoaL-like domain
MEPKLVRAIDDLEIRQVLARYCRGVDRLHEEMVDSCFWPSEAGSCSVFCGPFSGSPKDWIDFVFARMRNDLLTTHHLCQSLISIEGDEAEAESYFLARHVYDENDSVIVMAVAGRYLDKIDRRAGNWRIARRRVMIDLRQFSPAGTKEANSSGAAIGRQPDDPSFELSLLGRGWPGRQP